MVGKGEGKEVVRAGLGKMQGFAVGTDRGRRVSAAADFIGEIGPAEDAGGVALLHPYAKLM